MTATATVTATDRVVRLLPVDPPQDARPVWAAPPKPELIVLLRSSSGELCVNRLRQFFIRLLDGRIMPVEEMKIERFMDAMPAVREELDRRLPAR